MGGLAIYERQLGEPLGHESHAEKTAPANLQMPLGSQEKEGETMTEEQMLERMDLTLEGLKEDLIRRIELVQMDIFRERQKLKKQNAA